MAGGSGSGAASLSVGGSVRSGGCCATAYAGECEFLEGAASTEVIGLSEVKGSSWVGALCVVGIVRSTEDSGGKSVEEPLLAGDGASLGRGGSLGFGCSQTGAWEQGGCGSSAGARWKGVSSWKPSRASAAA